MSKSFLRLLLVAAWLVPSMVRAQYDGYWRNTVSYENEPYFRVGGGQVTNFHVLISYPCGSYTYSSNVSNNVPSTISGNCFTTTVSDGIATFTFRGYFVSSVLCTGRYSFNAISACGSFGFGSWETAKVGDDPIIYRYPASQSFGTVAVGTTSDRTFTVGNVGGGTLAGTASGVSAPFSIVSGGSYSVGSFVYTSVVVRFSPVSVGSWTQSLSFSGGGGSTAQVSGTGAVINHNPTNILLSSTNVAENLPVGSTVGTLSAQDPDAGDTFVYALTNGTGGADNGSFGISSGDLLTSTSFNYEVKSNYSIRVRAADQGGLSTQKVFAIRVTDVDEKPDVQKPASSTNGGMIIRWSSITTHLYSIHYSTNLASGFQLIQSNIPATPTVNSYTDSATAVPQKFWKITTDP